MRTILAALLIAAASATHAQELSPSDRLALLGKATEILQAQRDEANNRYVNSEAFASVLKEQLAAARKETAALRTELDKLKPTPAEPKQ